MSILVAIDPGLRHCGVAVFRDKTLVYAALPRNPEQKKRGAVAWRKMAQTLAEDVFEGVEELDLVPPDDLVLECPQVYPGPRNEDPNDLIEIAGVDGAIIGHLDPVKVRSYFPREWKGQVPKDIHNRRILKALTPDEKALLDELGLPASLLHNVVDAVGLGLFAVGRMSV